MYNEVYVEKIDTSTKTSNTINASDGIIKFANNIELGTSGVLIYLIE